MYTVLIAEDEMLVRMGLAISVPWDSLNMRVVAEVADGQSALDSFMSMRPDIVITDIKMPGLDGMELIQRIRQIDSSCAIIVVTCVEAFDTLMSAMKMNVTAYLVKALMTQDDIVKAMLKARDALSVQTRPQSAFEDPAETQRHLLKAYLLSRSINREQLLCEYGRMGIELPRPDFVMLVKICRTGGVSPLLSRSIAAILRERLGGDGQTMILEADSVILALSGGASNTDVIALARETDCYTRESFSSNLRMVLVQSAPPFAALPELLGRAQTYLEKDFCFDENPLCLSGTGEIADEAILAAFDRMKTLCWCFRHDYSVDVYLAKVNRLWQSLGGTWPEILGAACQLADDVVGDERKQAACRLLSAQTGLHDLIRALMEKCVEPAAANIDRGCRPELLRAIWYIAEHLNEDLSLNRLADRAGLHPVYFSNVFKREMGVCFSDFLRDMRIERSKTMLFERALSIQQVSEQCGFSDVAYFCKKFKQSTSMTPTQWRKQL